MGTALDLHQPSAGLARAKRWADIPPAERKRRAVLAANARDRDELVDLLASHLTLFGRHGARLSPHTVQAYSAAIGHLIAGWHHVNLLHPTRDDAAVLVRTWETQAKPQTVSVRVAACRALYRALRWALNTENDPDDKRGPDPFGDVRVAVDPVPAWEKRQPYADRDVDRLLESIEPLANPDGRLLVLLCAHGGLRISEALALTGGDVDLQGRTLTVRCGKGGKSRTVDLGRSLLQELEHATLQADGRYLHWQSSQGARKAMARFCAAAGVDYKAVHSLRHSCGTRLYQQTGKLEVVQRRLGHSNISTSQIYAKMGDKRVRDAVSDW
jgi:integrase/recombinase XerC